MQSEDNKALCVSRKNELAHVIVLANEKGGSGKSTTAMHVATYLSRKGFRVGCLDLDARQGTLQRYINNRIKYLNDKELELVIPAFSVMEKIERENRSDSDLQESKALDLVIGELRSINDFLVVDTPGSNSFLARHVLQYADTLLTPMNDSFVDLDVLGEVDPDSFKVTRLSHYADQVFQQRKRRAAQGGRAIDWVVMRNRLATLDSHNNRVMGLALEELANRIGFRVVHGLTERVIFRELFLKGLTLLDLRDIDGEIKLSMSCIAARQEITHLVNKLHLRCKDTERAIGTTGQTGC